MEEIMKSKRELREEYLGRRRAMSQDDVLSKSRLIHERMQELSEYASARTILTYVSSKDNEVDTLDLIESLLEEGKTVLVPIAEKNRVLVWSRLEALSELAPAQFGILEPLPEFRRLMDPPTDSVALAPGIAFTETGYRIGYGGGYYDTFLATFKGLKIGLAFEVQLLTNFPLEKHDRPVDIVITETCRLNAI